MKSIAAFLMLFGAVSLLDAQVYQPINYPGANFTVVTGINSRGTIVGYYILNNYDYCFELSAGVYTTITPAGAECHGINDSGTVAGFFMPSGGTPYGFLWKNGVYTSPIIPPGTAEGAYALGIGNGGLVVGYYIDINGDNNGFSWNSNTNTYETIDLPGAVPATQTMIWGVNNGRMVGQFYPSAFTDPELATSFLYSNGTFIAFNTWGTALANCTLVTGLNASGAMVGDSLTDGCDGNQYGFLLQNGNFTELSYPGSSITLAYGVDADGDVAGSYFTTNDLSQGYVYWRSAAAETAAGEVVKAAPLDPVHHAAICKSFKEKTPMHLMLRCQ